jgi:ATP-binding cassette subfamily B protein
LQLSRVAHLFGPYRARLGAVLGLIFISAGLGMVSPFLLKEILDTAIRSATPAC